MSNLNAFPADLQAVLVKILADKAYRLQLQSRLAPSVEALAGQQLDGGLKLMFVGTGTLAIALPLSVSQWPDHRKSTFAQGVQASVENLLGLHLGGQARLVVAPDAVHVMIELDPEPARESGTADDELSDLELEMVAGGGAVMTCPAGTTVKENQCIPTDQ